MFRLPMQQSLEELLIQTNLISPPQLAVAQRDAEVRSKPLAQTVIDLGFVSDRKFAEWIAGVTKLPIVDPLRTDVISEFVTYMPAAVAHEYEVVALDVDADQMTIATVNPSDRASIDAVQSATGMKIQAVIAIYGQLAEMLERFYPKTPAFDPSRTIAVAAEVEPFPYGDDTMLRMHSQQVAFEGTGDDSLGSDTKAIPPSKEEPANPSEGRGPRPEASETQLDRIERILEALQRRVDAIDATLARVVNRE
jgi:type II secretion system (T2SS) protein E